MPLIPVVVVFQTQLPLHGPLTPLVQEEPFGPLKRVQVPVPSLHVHEKVPVTFLDVAAAGWLKHSENESIRIAQAMRASPAVSIIRIWRRPFPRYAIALIPRTTSLVIRRRSAKRSYVCFSPWALAERWRSAWASSHYQGAKNVSVLSSGVFPL